VQVTGLQPWVMLIPGVSRDALDPARRAAAEDRFELLHTVLGKVIGETVGYTLTASFTVLVAYALHRTVLRGWLTWLGYVAAILIATGVVIPVFEPASLTNFAGYVLWCLWLLLVAGALVRRTAVPVASAVTA
jgi:ABC-type glycerol-3-phosphate transport system permease component